MHFKLGKIDPSLLVYSFVLVHLLIYGTVMWFYVSHECEFFLSPHQRKFFCQYRQLTITFLKS